MSASPRGRVLVADDHPLMLSLLQRSFEERGYDVAAEAGADRVAGAVERMHPDVVVVDVQMKPFERFHALEALGELPAGERPAIIALSGDDEPAIRQRSLELGADAFVLKPWDPDELIELVERLTASKTEP